ncbi:threonine synthase [Buchnera aphidicola (Nipponaphis monzeni)]|uniref:Threonine synthase n=1 Tax=Buchnera aphidicola (Nipponaphis monzeni) TaxID=2495405 RepID=A0A455TA15_9GAMM|nr:threonine synthase [Buchnera aphidicola]BBI01172.1 threonine synthase [Buchnera aphidicola (Nipponaphis monzeni)]
MKLYNLKDPNEKVNFSQAVKLGLGHNQGLFFPKNLPKITPNMLKELLEMNFIERSSKILELFIGDEISKNDLFNKVKAAFSFYKPIMKPITKKISCFELFHGPTLAFKDFGARFMAQILSFLNQHENKLITILTATSGDTGAAVAHAFYKMKNVKVIILYPKNKISKLQEKMFCTLGHNIKTIAIEGSFDECQTLVKMAFDDQNLKIHTGLNSANSINISRLLAQICYYFEAFSLIENKYQKNLIISVPCGNFGNLTAGLLAKSIGLPIKSFIAATNANDTVPNFLKTGVWKPKKTISTISNAMDISQPNNWLRVEEIFKRNNWNIQQLNYGSVTDIITKQSLKELFSLNYISEPHASIAYTLLKNNIKNNEYGIFLGTAHPAKFKQTVDDILQQDIPLPTSLKKRVHLKLLSYHMKPNFSKLRSFLLGD